MFCQACGQQLDRFALACSRCGAPIGTGVRTGTSAPVGSLATPPGLSERRRLTAGLLQILLPGLGIGRFYTGHTVIGVAQILVSALTCGFGALWAVVDGILMLMGRVTDAQGRTLRD